MDLTAADNMLSRLDEAIKDSKKRSMRYGANLIRKDQGDAFARHAAPSTGASWASRKRNYSWPLMWNSGNLMRMVTAGWGIKTKTGNPKLFCKLNNDSAENHIKAGALHFGRPGKSRRAGSRRANAARRPMAARPFLGISKGSTRAFKKFWEDQIKAAVD